MISIEDMLLQLILKDDSFTYYCAAFRHHVALHRTAPCCTHHHYVASHQASLIMTIPITVLHYVPLLHHVVVLTYALAAPCLLVVPCFLVVPSMLIVAC